MNKFAMIIALVAVSALSSQAACCGKKCGAQRTIKVGGCCQKYWNPIQSTENALWKVVPYDIQMLSDDSLVKQRYIKCFDLIGKSIKSWTRQKYASRRQFLDGKLWQAERRKLVAALDRNTRLARDPSVTKEDVLKMAEEMIVYGRALTVGNSCGMGLREIADLYRFDTVGKFLKDAMEFQRYRRKGFAKEYPSELQEFKDFECLARALNPVEWGEFRTRLGEMNAVYKRSQAATANHVCKR